MNKAAGRGSTIILTFRLEDGQAVPLMVDTGSPWTILDKSLIPKLGKRIGSTAVAYAQSGKVKRLGKYRAPKLYLGTFLLDTSNDIVLADHFGSTMGILGLDILRRYRIQLDFQTGSFRLLATNDLKAAELGKAFPIQYSGGHAVIHHDGLIGSSTNLIIDTGCNTDALINKGGINGLAVILPRCIWDRVAFTDLVVVTVDHVNGLGLGFLARHLVTLDFPNRTLYLKQTLSGPLAGNIFREISSAHAAPVEFLVRLKQKGQLPGFSTGEEATIYYKNSDLVFRPYGLIFGRWEPRKSLTFDFCKNEDASIFHYRVFRISGNDPWKLKKAWRTDQNGRLIEEYPIPVHSA